MSARAAAIVVLLSVSSVAYAQDSGPVKLALGEQKSLAIGEVSQIIGGDSEIVSVQADGKKGVTLTAKAEGKDSVMVYLADGGHKEIEVVVGTGLKKGAGDGARFGGKPIPNGDCGEPPPKIAALLEEGARRLGKKDKVGAKAVFQKAVAAEPKLAVTHMMLAGVLEQVGDKKKAAAEYETFVLTCPDHEQAPMIRQILSRY